jgi:hypothetical protein
MVKVHVVRDEKGKVVATFERKPVGEISLEPVLEKGHTVQEVEAEEGYHTNLKAFYERHARK